MSKAKPIPVHEGRSIAQRYGYDQILIIGRKVDPDGEQWHTTYGRNREHCDAAGRIMRWLERQMDAYDDPEKRALIEAILNPTDTGETR